MWRVKLHRNLQQTEMAVEDGPNYPPVKTPMTASRGRHGKRLDSPLAIMPLQALQPSHDVAQPRWKPPMALCRKVQDPGRGQPLEEVRLTQPSLLCGAAHRVVIVHTREVPSESKGDTLAHHTHTIHRVHERLRPRQEQAASLDTNRAHWPIMRGPARGPAGRRGRS